jgi:hypothetical protein
MKMKMKNINFDQYSNLLEKKISGKDYAKIVRSRDLKDKEDNKKHSKIYGGISFAALGIVSSRNISNLKKFWAPLLNDQQQKALNKIANVKGFIKVSIASLLVSGIFYLVRKIIKQWERTKQLEDDIKNINDPKKQKELKAELDKVKEDLKKLRKTYDEKREDAISKWEKTNEDKRKAIIKRIEKKIK